MTVRAALPVLDLSAPGFSTRGPEVIAARAAHWCARTPYGFAVLRHRQAGVLLRDRRLRQGSHDWPGIVGLKGSFADFWTRSIISQEGAPHRALRRAAQEALSEAFVLNLEPRFSAIAANLLEEMRSKDSFDFIESFSEPFAGRAISTLLNVDESEAPRLARDASTLGLAMGMDAPRHEAAVNAACSRLQVWSEALIARAETGEDRHGYVARLLAHGQDLSRQETVDLIVISIFGGVDTTRAQLAFAVALFAQNPDQWVWLKEHPESVPHAIEEVIRARPTTTWATRQALEGFEMDGVQIEQGDILHILVHATATDPLAGDWNGFDITARRKVHFGFGGGAHHCLGQFVARTDMACALREMLARWEGIDLAGDPDYLPDSGNTSPRSLPIAPIWA